MATERQIAANKLNAQRSTGPKTEEGKAKSSINRLSHGFTSTAITIPGEDPHEFQAVYDDFTAEYQPATVTEQVLVETMATHRWLSLRAFRLQGEAFIELALSADGSLVPKNLGLLIRYHSTADRAFHKAHNELVKTQKERKKSQIGFVPQNAAQPARPPADPFPPAPLEFKINPDFTYMTPGQAAKAATFKKAA